MTREELKAHLKANQEHVRRMTEEVSQQLKVMQESNERFKAEVREDLANLRSGVKGTVMTGVGIICAFLAAVIPLAIYLAG
jgi:D-ribose pyranose/furanose isomerase RbsD